MDKIELMENVLKEYQAIQANISSAEKEQKRLELSLDKMKDEYEDTRRELQNGENPFNENAEHVFAEYEESIKNREEGLQKSKDNISELEQSRKDFLLSDENIASVVQGLQEIDNQIRQKQINLQKIDINLQEYYMKSPEERHGKLVEDFYREQRQVEKEIKDLTNKKLEFEKFLDEMNVAMEEKYRINLNTEPVQAEPTQAEPAQAEPTQAEPAQAEPTQAEPTQAEPAQAEPAEAEPTQAEPAQAEPAEPEPAQAEPTEAEPVQAEPTEPESVQAKTKQPFYSSTFYGEPRIDPEPAQAEPTQAEPTQAEPTQAEPAKEPIDENKIQIIRNIACVITADGKVAYLISGEDSKGRLYHINREVKPQKLTRKEKREISKTIDAYFIKDIDPQLYRILRHDKDINNNIVYNYLHQARRASDEYDKDIMRSLSDDDMQILYDLEKLNNAKATRAQKRLLKKIAKNASKIGLAEYTKPKSRIKEFFDKIGQKLLTSGEKSETEYNRDDEIFSTYKDLSNEPEFDFEQFCKDMNLTEEERKMFENYETVKRGQRNFQKGIKTEPNKTNNSKGEVQQQPEREKEESR